MTLLAYHNDPKIKHKYLSRVRAHRKADELISGTYWEDGKGCAVGCTIHGSDHSRYLDELGIPVEIAYLEDAIFEGLPNGQALKWPEAFLSAIRPGVDLSMVWPKFAYWLLVDEKHGVVRFSKEEKDVEDAINQVAGLYKQWIDEDVKPNQRKWDAAWNAAWIAAWAAENAAGAAARAAAGAAARAAHWQTMSQKLIKLLKEAR